MKKYLFIIIAGIILTLSLYIICLSPLNNQTDTVSNNDFNIVLITIDTLRADHLSCYGYERNTSPNIDKIAKEGIRFTHALATSSWTAPSMASIMTSLYPISHGVKHGIIKSEKAYNQEILDEKFNALAEILKNHGYTTFGAAANFHLFKEMGFGQGFDYYYCKGLDNASALNDVIFSWKDNIKKCKKFFLWAHYFDPHEPYYARTPWINDYAAESWIGNTHLSKSYIEKLKKLIPVLKKETGSLGYLTSLYDSEINYVDYHIGNLIYELGSDDNSLIIITSDHGEEFLDHGSLGHATTLYQELIHVPLIIKLPFSFRESIDSVNDEPVSIIDIFPTILGVLEITPPSEIKGINLLDIKKQPKRQKRDYLFSELTREQILKTILSKNWKYIYNYRNKKGELYNITKDNREMENMIHKESSIAKELRKHLSHWISTSPKASPVKKKVKYREKTIEKLKSLGYISNGEQESARPPTKGCKSIPDENQK